MATTPLIANFLSHMNSAHSVPKIPLGDGGYMNALSSLFRVRIFTTSPLLDHPRLNFERGIWWRSRERSGAILEVFLSDYKRRKQYMNPWNVIRMGKLLEDLDVLVRTLHLSIAAMKMAQQSLCYW
ncbi:hypothetical protein FF1_004317 [Malus domestica]